MENHSGRKIEVSYSPALFSSYFHDQDCIVVVIDVFRATSAMCAAFEHGVEGIIPVATLDEARAYQAKGYAVGAERDGQVVEGFQFGNSPFSFTEGKFAGQTIVLTTTNGTRAISVAKEAHQIVVGSFLNLNALVDWLVQQDRHVLLQCAGWKNRFNLEDTLFAGAVASALEQRFEEPAMADSAIAAKHLYHVAENDLNGFLANSSHRRRLKRLHLEKDINYCLTPNQSTAVPLFNGEMLVNVAEKVSVE